MRGWGGGWGGGGGYRGGWISCLGISGGREGGGGGRGKEVGVGVEVLCREGAVDMGDMGGLGGGVQMGDAEIGRGVSSVVVVLRYVRCWM